MSVTKIVLILSILMYFPVYDIPMDYELQKHTYQVCQKYNMSYELVLAVINKESSFRVNAVNKNSKGLMQLNSDTYPWIAKELGIDNFDPFNSKHNIRAGVWYLDYIRDYWLAEGYGDEDVFSLMLISYNRGINGCKQYISKYGLDNEYVNDIFDYKIYLEQKGALYNGSLGE